MPEERSTVGDVAELHVAATKGFALRAVPEVQVTPTGVAGNREFFVVDIDERLYSAPKDAIFLQHWTSYEPSSHVFTIGRGTDIVVSATVESVSEVRSFEFDERVVHGSWAPGPWDQWLSDMAGRHLRLARCAQPGGGFDIFPVTLHSTASLASLGDELDGRPLDPRRFRLNLTLNLGAVPFIEDEWDERVLVVGASVLRLRGGIPRCLAVESRPDDGDRTLQVLRRVRAVRGATPSRWGQAVLFGVYAEVLRPGQVAIGDVVELGS
ncbi:MOSC domain-containing protein [Nocardioides sp. CN2-186]|uniref:MOSC domain-containing protein n=1 Tax=Nocardioides tweenelious TaxID=3156607 RepID=UPI0032B49EDE